MKCNYCEYEVKDDCKYCPNCGENPRTKKKNKIKEELELKDNSNKSSNSINTESLFPLWGLLGFFVPIVGLILFIVWNKTKPKEAKAAGIGALARVIINFFYLFVFGMFRFIVNR